MILAWVYVFGGCCCFSFHFIYISFPRICMWLVGWDNLERNGFPFFYTPPLLSSHLSFSPLHFSSSSFYMIHFRVYVSSDYVT